MTIHQYNMKAGVNVLGRVAFAAAALALAAGLAGCRGERTDSRPRQILPDMDDSPKWKPQTGSEFFADGRSMRPRVDHTVSFGVVSNADDPRRASYLKENEKFYYGTDGVLANGEPKFLDSIPFASIPGWPSDPKDTEGAMTRLIERGRERFTIYCAACHGDHGDGKGEVGVRWAGAVANFHESKFIDRKERTGKDGYIFYAIRNGVWDRNGQRVLDGHYRISATETLPADKQLMPPYSHAVDEADAWAIVSYVRVLQALRTTNMNEIPAAELERLMKAPAPASAPEASPATPPATPTPAPTSGATGGSSDNAGGGTNK